MEETKSANRDFVIGLDVAKAKIDVCLRLPNSKLRSKVLPNMDARRRTCAWRPRGSTMKVYPSI
jgi:hypothetical protein